MFNFKSNTITINEDLYNKFISCFHGNVTDFVENAMKQYMADLNKQQRRGIDYQLRDLLGKKHSVMYRIATAYFIARHRYGRDNIHKEDLFEICKDRWDMRFNVFNANFCWMRYGSGQCKQQIFDNERKKVYLADSVKDFLEENKDSFIQDQEEDFAADDEVENTQPEENHHTRIRDKKMEAYIYGKGYACNDWKQEYLLAVFDILRTENRPMTVPEVRSVCFNNYRKYGIENDSKNRKIIYECLYQHADCNHNPDAARHYKFFIRDNFERYFFNNHTIEELKGI